VLRVKVRVGTAEKYAVLKGVAKNSLGNILCEVEMLLTTKEVRDMSEQLQLRGNRKELFGSDIRIIVSPENLSSASEYIGLKKEKKEYKVTRVFSSKYNRIYKRNKYQPWGRVYAPEICEQAAKTYWLGKWSDKWSGFKRKKGSFWYFIFIFIFSFQHIFYFCFVLFCFVLFCFYFYFILFY
jgi:hypothetical protein